MVVFIHFSLIVCRFLFVLFLSFFLHMVVYKILLIRALTVISNVCLFPFLLLFLFSHFFLFYYFPRFTPMDTQRFNEYLQRIPPVARQYILASRKNRIGKKKRRKKIKERISQPLLLQQFSRLHVRLNHHSVSRFNLHPLLIIITLDIKIILSRLVQI